MADKIKWLAAVVLVIGGLVGCFYYADHVMWMRVLAQLAVVIVCAVIVLLTESGRQLAGFFRESQIELRKVVWPTGNETTQTTLVVMAMVVVFAVFLWLLDGGRRGAGGAGAGEGAR